MKFLYMINIGFIIDPPTAPIAFGFSYLANFFPSGNCFGTDANDFSYFGNGQTLFYVHLCPHFNDFIQHWDTLSTPFYLTLAHSICLSYLKQLPCQTLIL